MSNQLKLLLYIIFVVGIFYFLQNKFNLFDISFVDDIKIENVFKESEESKEVEESLKEWRYL